MHRLQAVFALTLTAASLCDAQRVTTHRDEMLISTATLASQLGAQDLVLLHVGTEKDYGAKHLPGARLARLDDIADSDRSGPGLVLEMPAADRLRERLAALGISDDSHIVVYDGNNSVSATARVYLTLAHAGLGDRTRLLDGGMQQWIRDGKVVTDVVPQARTGRLGTLRLTPSIVDAQYVKAHVGKSGISIVDARLTPFYDGVQAGRDRNGPQRPGHIAGARSLPFSSLYDETNRLLPAAELAARFARAGIAPTDTVVGYCHIGQQATAMLFAARALGHPILLYDGSFEDWSRRPAADYPVERSPSRGTP